MEIAYTARNKFNPTFGDSWTKYIEWCKLKQLEELISLDAVLCETSFVADLKSTETWENAFDLNSAYFADIYKSISYILSKVGTKTEFNLLAVAFEPNEECGDLKLDNFKFIGYDLLDQDHSTSALTNCGGFEETFNNSELNKNGLIDTYERAVEIKRNLLINNEEEYHADTNLWAVWRHKTIGQKE